MGKTTKGGAQMRIVKIVHSGVAFLRPIKGAPGDLELRILATKKDAVAAGLSLATIDLLGWRRKSCQVVIEMATGAETVMYCEESKDCPELCSLVRIKDGKKKNLGKVGLIGLQDGSYECPCKPLL